MKDYWFIEILFKSPYHFSEPFCNTDNIWQCNYYKAIIVILKLIKCCYIVLILYLCCKVKGVTNSIKMREEFFEVFITVSGIGPRAALKALNKPISLIAKAIDEADLNFLQSLPGIGQQRAKEIVAKLQNKVGKFGLIQDQAVKDNTAAKNISEEALDVLLQLEYKRSEALGMIKKVLEMNSQVNTTEELLNLVYKQKRLK